MLGESLKIIYNVEVPEVKSILAMGNYYNVVNGYKELCIDSTFARCRLIPIYVLRNSVFPRMLYI